MENKHTINISREPDKERYLKAARHIETAEVPFFETEVDYMQVRKLMPQDIPPVRSYLLPPELYLEFLKRTGMDMAYLYVPWKFGRKEVVDSRGISIYAGGTIKDYSDLKQMKDPGTDGIKKRIEEMLDVFKDTKIGIIYALNNANRKVTEALGYELSFSYLIEKPDFVREFQKRVDEIFMKEEEVILSYPIDAVMVGCAPCMKSGIMISMEMMEEFMFPYLQRSIDMAHKKNIIVSSHADGNQTALYPRYIEMGVEVIHAVEKCGDAQDIFKLKELYGDKMAFHGSIDVEGILIKGGIKDVEEEVSKHIQILGKGGGYICGSNHDINEDIPIENFIAMLETAQTTTLT